MGRRSGSAGPRRCVLRGLREHLRRELGRRCARRLVRELADIRRRCSALPVLDRRSADDVIDYDERGLPR